MEFNISYIDNFFNISISYKKLKWNIKKRYSDFLNLKDNLIKEYNIEYLNNFPKKTFFKPENSDIDIRLDYFNHLLKILSEQFPYTEKNMFIEFILSDIYYNDINKLCIDYNTLQETINEINPDITVVNCNCISQDNIIEQLTKRNLDTKRDVFTFKTIISNLENKIKLMEDTIRKNTDETIDMKLYVESLTLGTEVLTEKNNLLQQKLDDLEKKHVKYMKEYEELKFQYNKLKKIQTLS